MDFFEKYRPRCLAEIAGQTEHVTWLRNQVRSRRDGSVLISGPTGSGKTSAAWTYARAILCEAPADGDSCGQCESCSDFKGLSRKPIPNLHILDCGENGNIAAIKDLLKTARIAPLGARRRLFLLDEVHSLSRHALNALLRETENPARWSRFILLTDQPERLPRALRSRVHHLSFGALNEAEGCQLLQRVCAAEGVSHERLGLAEVYRRVGGSARDLLRVTERLLPFGAITTTSVSVAFKNEQGERLASILAGVAGKDLAQVSNELRTWGLPTAAKVEAIHEHLVALYLRAHRFDNGAEIAHEVAIEKAFTVKVSEAASIFGTPTEECWEEVIDRVAPSKIVTDAELLMALKRVMNFLNPTGSAPLPPPPRSNRPRSFRVQRRSELSPISEYLKWTDIRPFWEAATFLPQHYGALFNIRVSVKGSPEWPHKAMTAVATAITQKLGMQIQYWDGGQRSFHWLSFHERCEGQSPTLRLLLSVPECHGEAAVRWLKSKISLECAQKYAGTVFQVSSRTGCDEKCRVRFHWQGIRLFSRCLDPHETERDEQGRRTPLANLLKIPPRLRTKYGHNGRAKKRGQSETLTGATRKRAGDMGTPFLSAVRERAWSFQDLGWELSEYEARRLERGRRQAALERTGDSRTASSEIAECLANERGMLEAEWPTEPRSWSRRWAGWWQPRRVRSRA